MTRPVGQPKAESRMLDAARRRADSRGGQDLMAQRIEAEARLKVPTELVVRGAGGELVPSADFMSPTDVVILDTLANPDAVAADASRDRLDLLKDAGALTLGLDAADAIEAKDGFERMLAHQMAALHASTLRMVTQMNRQIERMETVSPSKPLELAKATDHACRLVSAVTRLSGAYQAGMATMQRVRSGGRQTVIVQHNHVGEGGQAVIGGAIEGGRGAPKRGRGGK